MEDMLKIGEAFGLTPVCLYKTRYYYTLRTERGEYRLMSTALTSERLRELYNLKERLLSRGVTACDRLIPTPSGELYVEGEEGRYILVRGVRGRSLEFDSPFVMKEVFRTIGAVHRVLMEVDTPSEDILEPYIKGCRRLKDIRKQLNRSKRLNELDREFLRVYEDFYALGVSAIDSLDSLTFRVTCPIHGAVKEDNILVGRNIVLTDWEMLRPGHFMEDVAQLTGRYIRKHAAGGGSFITMEDILSAYAQENPVGDREAAILYALVMYPKRFISICKKHYAGAHRFAPQGVRSKLGECVEIRSFVLDYLGVKV